MITLFRRIREKLIASGSLTKYLLYAAGEILLVVIGILIALQVNNWNEERRAETSTQKVLKEIRQNLQQDLSSINEVSAFNEVIMETLVRLSECPESVPEDSLGFLMDRLHRASAFDPLTFGYAQLQDLELPDSIPDSLTRGLAAYYTEFAGGLNNIAYQELSIFNINKYRDYMIRQGFPVTERGALPSADADVLRRILRDKEFRGIIRSNFYSRNVQQGGFEEARAGAQKALDLINSYLAGNL